MYIFNNGCPGKVLSNHTFNFCNQYLFCEGFGTDLECDRHKCALKACLLNSYLKKQTNNKTNKQKSKETVL